MNIYLTYFCNFRCPFCFIPTELKAIKNRMDLNWLERQLFLLSKKGGLDSGLTLLGGEPCILPQSYLSDVVSLCSKYVKPKCITNLSHFLPIFEKTDLIVSYDFDVRQDKNKVLYNIMQLTQPFALSTVMTYPLVSRGSSSIINLVDSLSYCSRIDLHFLEMMSHISPSLNPTQQQLISFLRGCVGHKKVNIANLSNFKGIINLNFDNYSDRICLLPDNTYGVTSISEASYEKAPTLEEALLLYNKNISLIKEGICKNCEFLGSCCARNFNLNECVGKKQVCEYLRACSLT